MASEDTLLACQAPETPLPAVERRPHAYSSNSSSRLSVASSLSTGASSVTSDARPSTRDSDDAFGDDQSDNGLAPLGAPHNFYMVTPGLYRSSYPMPSNYDYLKQLGLKTIVTLVDKNFTPEYVKFMEDNHIRHYMFHMKGTKKEEIPLQTMKAILRLVIDKQNYPLLVHCNHGKHRTGCVVGVLRKIDGWDNERIVDEYKMCAGAKIRDCDVRYLTTFGISSISDLLTSNETTGDARGVSTSNGSAVHSTSTISFGVTIAVIVFLLSAMMVFR